jgi:hypothetical protein
MRMGTERTVKAGFEFIRENGGGASGSGPGVVFPGPRAWGRRWAETERATSARISRAPYGS